MENKTYKTDANKQKCINCGGKGFIIRQKTYQDDNSGIVNFYGNPVMEKVCCELCNFDGKHKEGKGKC